MVRNLELARYYAAQAKKVYDSTSYENLELIAKFERCIVEYSLAKKDVEEYSELFTAYYVGIIGVETLLDGLTE